MFRCKYVTALASLYDIKNGSFYTNLHDKFVNLHQTESTLALTPYNNTIDRREVPFAQFIWSVEFQLVRRPRECGRKERTCSAALGGRSQGSGSPLPVHLARASSAAGPLGKRYWSHFIANF